jgi:DNA-binding LacI/PurR family transcriptional regulator
MMANCWKRELEYAGFRVPEDFELMGYDANSCFSGFASVDIHPYECGKMASEELIAAIKERRQPRSKEIKASYIPGKYL